MLKDCYYISFQLKSTFFHHYIQKLVLEKKYSYFQWINERIEPISEEKIDMTNILID